jgi:hypothetical protein
MFYHMYMMLRLPTEPQTLSQLTESVACASLKRGSGPGAGFSDHKLVPGFRFHMREFPGLYSLSSQEQPKCLKNPKKF